MFRTGDEITLRLKYHCVEPEKTPKGNFGYGIFREDSVHCYGTNVEIESDSWVALQPNGEIEVRFRNHLLPGRYFWTWQSMHRTVPITMTFAGFRRLP